MNTSAIIAEYNPFHYGHKYQLDKTREAGATHIVAALDGHFVERGDLSICSKWARTEMALHGGADLVVEIPTIYALSGAANFARGGVSILNALGVVDTLSFGSECGDTALLQKAATAANSPLIKDALMNELMNGITFAKARENAVQTVFGKELAAILHSPNNNLAIEYITAINNIQSSITPFTIKRFGAEHDSDNLNHTTASASKIRDLILQNNIEAAKNYMPNSSYELLAREKSRGIAPVSIHALETAILAIVRLKTIEALGQLPDISEGIENRLYNATRKATSLDELYALIKCKRYPLARIRRLVLSAVLGITAEIASLSPKYIKVLGFNEKGKEILRAARKTATLPIVMRASQIMKLDSDAKKIFKIECSATDLYSLSTQKVNPCGLEMTQNICKF